MSYILDALNKSEQERQSSLTPGINSNQRQPIANQKKSMHWFLILIALTAVNGIGIYFWLQQSKPDTVNMAYTKLDFSAHVYGEDTEFRMVNINGNMIREGEPVTAMIELIEITEDGVILQYQQYLFRVGVLNNWQAN